MKDFDQLVSVWQGQPKRDQLSVDEALKQVKKGMGSLNKKLLRGITSMMVGFISVFLTMLFLAFESWVTYLGIGIMLSTMLLYVLVMVRDYRLITKQDVTTNPTEYLQSLKEYQHRRADMYGWLYYLYVLLLSIGLSLYFFEVLQSSSPTFKYSAYGITAAWLLFCTFYLRGRILKNEQEKLNLMIDRLVRLQGQFE
ncbi:hypothetical protein GCM10023149_02710 [Mucilaginibacter gynuensis]|uniref:Uncharacterized protein n=1 Tax=Mucilaginibacter gynuensis TaxID=1302236 RepID=A0ABP8FQ49_9SPHI